MPAPCKATITIWTDDDQADHPDLMVRVSFDPPQINENSMLAHVVRCIFRFLEESSGSVDRISIN